MSLITEVSNLDSLITPLQIHMGDIAGSTYSEAVYRTSLINAIRFLHTRWNGKYILSGVDIARNTEFPFTTTSPPIIENAGDEWAIILAATVILRGMSLTNSSSSFTNWSTPDLSVSSGSKERALTKLYDQSIADLNTHFKTGLGKSLKKFMYNLDGTYPTSQSSVDVPGT